MKKLFVILFFLLPLLSFSQLNDSTAALLQKLDSVRNSSSVSRYFATLYFETTSRALNFFSTCDMPVQHFMQRLELRFASYFFAAAQSFQEKKQIPAEWETYYTGTRLTPLQYFLLGANAHINGDIWQVLTSEFSLQELKEFKKPYYRYNKELKEELVSMYNNALKTVFKIRLLHTVTLGLDKQYGKLMLVRWRKRQLKLSMLWFTNQTRFENKLAGLQKKMYHLDKLILQNL